MAHNSWEPMQKSYLRFYISGNLASYEQTYALDSRESRAKKPVQVKIPLFQTSFRLDEGSHQYCSLVT